MSVSPAIRSRRELEENKNKCPFCEKVFYRWPSLKQRFCSRICSAQNLKGRTQNRDSENGMWSGDRVGYAALHSWVKRRLKRPTRCDICNKSCKPDLANISQEYLRDLNDWEWLCRKCHMVKDGRLKTLMDNAKKLKKFPNGKICRICTKTFQTRQDLARCCSKSCAATLSNRRRGKNIANTSGFKGVSPCGKKWKAQIRNDGKQINLGRFVTKEDAYKAYKMAAISLRGEYVE